MTQNFFITGIGTDVGKTVASAIVTEALEADYWKPVQAGDLEYSDTDKVKSWVSNNKSVFHSNAYALNTPMSPHAAADIDKVKIDLKKIKAPKTKNSLVIEGAGGLLVPLTSSETIFDLIQKDYKVIVVSRHYLGSINHTLMTLELLKQKGVDAYLIYNGNRHKTTEAVIEQMSDVPVLGRIEEEPYIDKNVVRQYAEEFKEKLCQI
ncbi:MAG: dethiobiotin synthase [Flavobacteriaceae bacterium]|nr:dethiobiotin synthase [Flavobacteriaceae bacterium]